MSENAKVELLEEVEIEAYAKRGEPVPSARHYVIRIDKETKIVTSSSLTGREILSLVGKTPDTYKLYEIIRGQQPKPIGPDDVVDLRTHGVERFTTMPRDTTEGLMATEAVRGFRLPEGDEEFLNSLALKWETIVDGETRWLIIHEYQVPPGYNRTTVKLALLIPPSYSDSQLDMVYFWPELSRSDGRAIPNLTSQTICGENWQRWSRHRTGANPWRAGVDDISMHLGLVDEWLRREFERA